MLATMGVAISITRLRELPMRPRPFLDLPAFKSRMFSFYNASQFFTFAGSFIPFFYIQQYAQEKANTSANLSYYTLSLMNAGSMFGRVIPGLVADRIGTMNTLLLCGPMSATLAFCWIAIHDTPGIIIFSVLYGFASGGFVSLQAPTVAHMCPEIDYVGTWLGMVAFSSGLGILIGNPVSGAILADGSWAGLQCLSGTFTMIGTAFIVATRCAKSGSKLMTKS
jgi:MFS family permease